MQVRVGHDQAGRVDHRVAVDQEVEVQRPRAPAQGAGGLAVASMGALDPQQRIQQRACIEAGFQQDGRIDEVRLLGQAPGRAAVGARARQQTRGRQLPQGAHGLGKGGRHVALVAAEADGGDIAAREAGRARAEAAVDDPVALADLDTKFHALIARASHNRVLELAREPAALLFFPTSEMICRKVTEGARRMVAAHRQLIDSIRERDLERAQLWMARHVTDWKKGFERTGRSIDEPVERSFDQEMIARLFR